MNSLPCTLPPNPGDRSGYAKAGKHLMHSIRAVRRMSGNKDPSSRKAPRVLFIRASFSLPAVRRPYRTAAPSSSCAGRYAPRRLCRAFG